MLTGEPYAGDPHVRFGGRGGASQCAVPTPMPWMTLPCVSVRLGRLLRIRNQGIAERQTDETLQGAWLS